MSRTDTRKWKQIIYENGAIISQNSWKVFQKVAVNKCWLVFVNVTQARVMETENHCWENTSVRMAWGQAIGAFSQPVIDREGPVHSEQCYPWGYVFGVLQKQTEQAMGEKSVNNTLPWLLLSVLAPRFLP